MKYKYHVIMPDAYYENEQTIGDYELTKSDYFAFLKGKRYKGRIPDRIKLYICEGDENLPMAALLAGSLSWLIFSHELLNCVKPMIEQDVQIFDAPVYFRSGERVDGYKIINPIRVIDCIDWDKSDVVSRKNGTRTASITNEIVLKEHAIGDHHIFLVKGLDFIRFVSDELAQTVSTGGFKGIAFKRIAVS